MRSLLALLACLLTGCASMPVEVGQSYLMSYDCVPEWMAHMAAQQMDQAANPCYVEVVQVLKRRGPWIDVAVSGGVVWTVNSAQVSSFTHVETGPAPASRESSPDTETPSTPTVDAPRQRVRRTP